MNGYKSIFHPRTLELFVVKCKRKEKRMSVNKKIVQFMEYKGQLLKKKGVRTKYVDKIIKKNVLLWNKKEAKEVLLGLCGNIIYAKAAGLGVGTCPYCIRLRITLIKRERCQKCFYGKHFGICEGWGILYINTNNYGKIVEELGDLREEIYNQEYIKILYKLNIKRFLKENGMELPW